MVLSRPVTTRAKENVVTGWALRLWATLARATEPGRILAAGLVTVTLTAAAITVTASPAAAVDTRFEVKTSYIWDGNIKVDYRQYQGNVQHQWPGSNGWQSLGHPPNALVLGSPSMGRTPDGRLTVFVVAEGNRELWHKWQLCDGCGWSDWVSLGGGLNSNPSVIYKPIYGGIFVAFALAHDGDLWHTWQLCAGCTWSTWTTLNAMSGVSFIGAPEAEFFADATKVKVEISAYPNIAHRRQPTLEGPWGDWSGGVGP
jgi:hypothetical protein